MTEIRDEQTSAAELIAAERQRQIDAEGWTPEHDDEHDQGELAKAGASYALRAFERSRNWQSEPPSCWPWTNEWWKASSDDPIRNLVKAGALIAAEIDRLERARA